MMTNSIAEIIEATTSHLAKQAGIQNGAETSSIESIVSNYGNFYTSLAYVGFFFPTIRLVNGIPFATFPTAKTEHRLNAFMLNCYTTLTQRVKNLKL